jgi:hypothetical protein
MGPAAYVANRSGMDRVETTYVSAEEASNDYVDENI